jgi:flotillin
MESLGATQTALVKREAAEGKARNQAEARKKVAQYDADAEMSTAEALKEAHIAVNVQKQAEAESDRDLNLKKAVFDTEVNRAKAQASAAGEIEQAKQHQAVIRETTQQEVVAAQVRLEVTDRDVERVKKEKEGASLADLMEERNKVRKRGRPDHLLTDAGRRGVGLQLDAAGSSSGLSAHGAHALWWGRRPRRCVSWQQQRLTASK